MRGYYGYKTQTQEWQVFIFILRDLAYNEKVFKNEHAKASHPLSPSLSLPIPPSLLPFSWQLARKKVVQELSHNLFETEELQAIDLLNSKPYIHLGIQSETEMNSKLSALNGQEIHNGWRILPGALPCRVRNE